MWAFHCRMGRLPWLSANPRGCRMLKRYLGETTS